METERGDRVLHHVANTHPWHSHDKSKSRSRSQRNSRDNQRSVPPKGSMYAGWSIKSLFKGGEDQKKQRKSAPEPKRSSKESRAESREASIDYEREAREALRLQEERREKFRNAKSSYVPVQTVRSPDDLQFDPSRMQADVGKAVKEAANRSSAQMTRR